VVLARQGAIIYPNKLSVTTYLEHMPLFHDNAHKESGRQKKFRISMKHITYKPTAKHQEVCVKRQMQELALRRWKERCKVTLNSIAMEIWQAT